MFFSLCSSKNKSVKEIFDRFENNQNSIITYKELETIPVGEPFYIAEEGISAIRLKTTEKNSLSFRVTMEPNCEWGLHKHDCNETIIVYKGECVDLENQNIIKRGGYYFIKKNISHKIVSLDREVIFYVEFNSPKEVWN
jgi:quercetin dioxygenase-like cupin family protein